MKYQILLISLLFFSCKKEKSNYSSVEKVKEERLVEEQKPPELINKKVNNDQINADDLIGYYVGDFRAVNFGDREKSASYVNKINISVDRIIGDSIYGHSIVAGNSRSFKGIIDNEKITSIVKEPGDDKYDGVFSFKFSNDNLLGKWVSNDKTLSVIEREFKLIKREFKYAPNLNLHFNKKYDHKKQLNDNQDEYSGHFESIEPQIIFDLNASLRELKNVELENLNKGELEIIRNLIYARHGYSFKNRKMRYFFDSQIDWYIPVSTDVRKELTDIELNNIDLIKRYEQHAERYYDYFGR